MPRRLRKLLGLSKVEDEHGYKAPKQTPTVASVAAAPLSADYGAVDGGQTHNAPSRAEDKDGTPDETLLSGRNGTLSQTMAVDSNTTTSLRQTLSYWERATKQLEDKEPSVFAALQELRKESSRTSKDMPNEISQIIEQHRNTMENKQWSLPFKVRGREVKIRAQLDIVWKVLQIFNTIGTTLASLDPVHAGIPWAGIGFIVQGALSDSAQNVAAMEGLSRISSIVARYLQMEMIYLGAQDHSLHEDFEKCLVDLYAGILKYQVAAACHCKRSTFSRFLRALPRVDDWAAMLQHIDEKDRTCKDLASVFDSLDHRTQASTLQSIFQEQDKRLGSMQSMMQGNELESARAENARILSWICDYIPGRDHQDVMVHKKMGTRYAHTGQWLLDHHGFLSWRFGEYQGLSTLWVYGSVGTGKTSLVSRVIEWHLQGFQPEISETYGAAICEDHVDQRIRQADPESFGSIAYFYCVRQGQNQSGTDPAVILRSLVRQLAWPSDGSSISPRIRTFYDRWRYERPDSGRLSLGECSELLTELISSYSNTTIILDALDECEAPYELLRALKTIANSSTGHIKLLVSSRLNVNVSSVLIPRSKIDIQSQSTSKDMDNFLHTEVKKGDRRLLKGNFPELENRLIEVLRDRAQGMFRWAELQLAIFLDENTPFRLAEDVISKLDRLGVEAGLPDLDSVYDEIYQKNTRVDSRDRENVIKTFKFMLYSFVEWDLHDLANAISLGVDGTLNVAIDASYVLEICSNFLVVDHSGYVQFAHLSVPEYLKGGCSAIVFSDVDAHAQIAEVCLAYVMSPSAQEIVKKREVDRWRARIIADCEAICNSFNPLGPVPSLQHESQEEWERLIASADPWNDGLLPLGLHLYAFSLCLEHCELASMVKRQEGTLCRLFTTFMSMAEINPAFLALIERRRNTERFAGKRASKMEYEHWRNKNSLTRADPQDPFFAACAYGFTEILQDMRLIGKVDVDRRNRSCCWNKAPNPTAGETATDTPLYEVVRRLYPDIVALLLSRGADARRRYRDYGYYNVINKHALSHKDGHYEERGTTLLHILARMSLEPMQESKMSSIMSLLLEHGASIEAINDFSETPLHIVCKRYNSLAVSIFLHQDAFPGAQDRDGRTPLMYSVFNRTPPVVLELLLRKASIADIVRRADDGHSVLSYSISSLGTNDPDTTMLLLNTVDLRAARELGTREGDEFVELSDILKRIGCDFLIHELAPFMSITDDILSQRSMINRLQVIAEKIVMGQVMWFDADLCDKLRKEGVDVWWNPPDITVEEEEDDIYAVDDADDDNDTNSDGDAADEDNADDDDDTDSKNP